ncbi:polysaccharide pyruvyl transferase family protein [Antarcticibacterium sp. 1MA-6-2]|uniref:polysaccharide pyruvyl transferase family protein n=1 Tax=Antarcticibacterium sp. 1MA-6-2 TaxID=2908210 RepID=UPI001F2BAEC1|nr:polysaccharide pyruvyl transferase family protein [Antarcticibacterium sp. 1MA-6-2]UJH91289.1 polysaccharide pyruvyl transferase family protein [Antarcticibacterium sp. 1MA-6-2]
MLGRIKKHVGVLTNSNKRIVKWSSGKYTSNNIGDVLNEYLFEKIFKKEVVSYREVLNVGVPPVYSFIGSVLDNSAVKNLTVMGSGFKRETSKMVVKPKKVISCRGPLTRGKLIKMGLEVPEVYGDPAILLPQFYKPTVEKKYRMGLIPHYVDKDLEIVEKWSSKSDVKNIDVFSPMETFVADLKSCDFTVSSSLHGVILSHAYGIPSAWAPLSGKLAGGGFKFNDYYQSVKAETKKIQLQDFNSPSEVEKHTSLPQLSEISEKLLNTLKAVKV